MSDDGYQQGREEGREFARHLVTQALDREAGAIGRRETSPGIFEDDPDYERGFVKGFEDEKTFTLSRTSHLPAGGAAQTT